MAESIPFNAFINIKGIIFKTKIPRHLADFGRFFKDQKKKNGHGNERRSIGSCVPSLLLPNLPVLFPNYTIVSNVTIENTTIII